MPLSKFTPEQAVELAVAFAKHQVEYLFGKSGAILLGYPAVTQDVDLFLPKDPANAARVVAALDTLGFQVAKDIRQKILQGADFVQLKHGPFDLDLDLIHAPDGIESYAAAKARSVVQDGFPVTNLCDIIASKRASGRQKDLLDPELLEQFRVEYERRHAPAIESAALIGEPGAERRSRKLEKPATRPSSAVRTGRNSWGRWRFIGSGDL